MTSPYPEVFYSNKYSDDEYEYRHVILPRDIAKRVPQVSLSFRANLHLINQGKLMAETEWRALGVQQSRGWVHYMLHRPEPHILLFRRPITQGQR